jgi:hypothetical protein
VEKSKTLALKDRTTYFKGRPFRLMLGLANKKYATIKTKETVRIIVASCIFFAMVFREEREEQLQMRGG